MLIVSKITKFYLIKLKPATFYIVSDLYFFKDFNINGKERTCLNYVHKMHIDSHILLLPNNNSNDNKIYKILLTDY
jgi:hypothetical protein